MLQFLAAAGLGGGVPSVASFGEDRCHSAQVTWVADSLNRMLAIKPGMSRDQLMRVFSIEGGLSTALKRTFVSRDCPYFKVDVTFRRAANRGNNGDPDEWVRELDNDVITSIFRPYLQFSIMD